MWLVAPRLGLQIVRAFRVKRCGFRLCRERGRAATFGLGSPLIG
jgi:hypothetical protein